MENFKPFENDTQSTNVGPGEGLTFENNQEYINVYGDITIEKNADTQDIDKLIGLLTDIKDYLNQVKKNDTKMKNG